MKIPLRTLIAAVLLVAVLPAAARATGTVVDFRRQQLDRQAAAIAERQKYMKPALVRQEREAASRKFHEAMRDASRHNTWYWSTANR